MKKIVTLVTKCVGERLIEGGSEEKQDQENHRVLYDFS